MLKQLSAANDPERKCSGNANLAAHRGQFSIVRTNDAASEPLGAKVDTTAIDRIGKPRQVGEVYSQGKRGAPRRVLKSNEHRARL